MNTIRRFLKEEQGLEPVEYALLLVLIAIAAIAGATLLGKAVNLKFTQVAGKLDAVTP